MYNTSKRYNFERSSCFSALFSPIFKNSIFSMYYTCLFRKEIVKKSAFNETEKNRSKNLTIRINAWFWRFLFFWHFFNKFISPDFWVKYSFFSSFPISLKITPFRCITRVYLGRKLSKSQLLMKLKKIAQKISP